MSSPGPSPTRRPSGLSTSTNSSNEPARMRSPWRPSTSRRQPDPCHYIFRSDQVIRHHAIGMGWPSDRRRRARL